MMGMMKVEANPKSNSRPITGIFFMKLGQKPTKAHEPGDSASCSASLMEREIKPIRKLIIGKSGEFPMQIIPKMAELDNCQGIDLVSLWLSGTFRSFRSFCGNGNGKNDTSHLYSFRSAKWVLGLWEVFTSVASESQKQEWLPRLLIAKAGEKLELFGLEPEPEVGSGVAGGLTTYMQT